MNQHQLPALARLERVTSALRAVSALSSPDAHLGPVDRDALTALLDVLIFEMETAVEDVHKAA